MSIHKPLYPGSVAVNITLASLAASGTWVAGQQSDEVDNSVNLYDDYLVNFKWTNGTSPGANTFINLYAIGWDAQSNAYPDVITGAGDSAKTWTSPNVQAAGAVLLKTIVSDSTSTRQFYATCISLAAAFGGTIPQKFVFFVSHNTGVAANSTPGNFSLTIQGVQWQTV